jgi:hypothetical protein
VRAILEATLVRIICLFSEVVGMPRLFGGLKYFSSQINGVNFAVADKGAFSIKQQRQCSDKAVLIVLCLQAQLTNAFRTFFFSPICAWYAV